MLIANLKFFIGWGVKGLAKKLVTSILMLISNLKFFTFAGQDGVEVGLKELVISNLTLILIKSVISGSRISQTEGGANPKEGCVNLLFDKILAKPCTRIKEIVPSEGGGHK